MSIQDAIVPIPKGNTWATGNLSEIVGVSLEAAQTTAAISWIAIANTFGQSTPRLAPPIEERPIVNQSAGTKVSRAVEGWVASTARNGPVVCGTTIKAKGIGTIAMGISIAIALAVGKW